MSAELQQAIYARHLDNWSLRFNARKSGVSVSSIVRAVARERETEQIAGQNRQIELRRPKS
jgi:hypothetical protein